MRVKWKKIKEFFFANQSLRQTVVKNTFWLTVGNLVGRLIRAVLIIYVARVLGAEGYGIFSYAVGLAAFFSIFSDIGVNGILTREGARNPAAMPEYLGTSLGIKVVLLTITNVILFAVTPHFAQNIPQALPLLPLAAILITSDSLRDLTCSITRAKESMQTEAGISIWTNFAITVIGGAAIFWRPTPLALMGGYTLGSIFGTILAYWLLRKHFVAPWKYFRRKLVIPILREGFPFALMGLLGTIMLNTDTIMVGWLTKASSAAYALGVYTAAQRPVQILYMVPSILSTVTFPSMSRLASEDSGRFRSLLERAISSSLLVGIPLVVGGLALGQNIVLLLFGAGYGAAAAPFMVLLFTIPIIFPGTFVSNAIFAKNAQKSFLWYLTLGAITNAGLDFLLIPHFGILGSSVATLCAQLLANGISWYKLKSIQNFQTLRYTLKIVLASLGMGLFAFALDRAGVPVLLTIAASGCVYFFLLYLLREPLLKSLLPMFGSAKGKV
jgi:O-antigen/teichoic acid export membrane protein